MIYLNTRMASTLFAFGIFFTLSCAQLGLTSSDEEQVYTSTEYEQQLEQVSEELTRNPGDAELEKKKAEILASIAANTSVPDQRNAIYANLRELGDTQILRDGESQPEIDNLIRTAWTNEQSEGVRLLQQEQDDMSDHTFGTVISHFENAITLNPDSLNTYSLLANTYYRHGDFNDAIHTLERSLERSQAAKPQIREKLAYLYLESGDIESSIELYTSLVDENPGDAHIRHGLANAHILDMNHAKAIEILRPLTEQYNTRYEYHEALASQLYFRFAEQAGTILQENESPSDEDAQLLIMMLEEADSIFETLSGVLPFHEEQKLRTATFYKNSAAMLNRLSTFADGEIREGFYAMHQDFLDKALPAWEALAENHPENIDYIRALIDVYSELGMDDDAESLKRSYNL